MDPKSLPPGNTTLVQNIVNHLKAKGIFDKFRHECLADVDTKPSYQNLSQRIDGVTSKFLANETWNPDSNKNDLRNKLRRYLDESGVVALGADIVVEQVFNPNMNQLFLPQIQEVVHQYVKDHSETTALKDNIESTSASEKPVNDVSENKEKLQISDPISDILSFRCPKSKATPLSSTQAKIESVQHKHVDTTQTKIESVQHKHVDTTKEEINNAIEKSTPEVQAEVATTHVNEAKEPIEKEKDKAQKEDSEIQQEVIPKITNEEIKFDKQKTDDLKGFVKEIACTSNEMKSTAPGSSNALVKTDEKSKHKSKSKDKQKSSSSSSEIKKSKKELTEKSEKPPKSKPAKASKDVPSPTKIKSPLKSVFKDETLKTKSHQAGCGKTSESARKPSKSGSDKSSSSTKHKEHIESNDKHKASKSVDKNEPHIHHDSSNSEKGSKCLQYSSSYDSSQGSDQEKNNSVFLKEKSEHFSKHATKEKVDNSDTSKKDKKSRGSDESLSKKYKNEKDVKLKLKDTVIEAAKISSRSNSFGSISSISSSSNGSKDNITSNSDEVSENSVKDEKKKQLKEKESCENPSQTLPPPPPPPPPPPSSSLSSELTSSAEMSPMQDTQSSVSDSETSASEDISEESSSDMIDNLSETTLNSSTDKINEFYDIFLYSSSSSEFDGYENSPERKNNLETEPKSILESDISSVHTSDLSSFDDKLSSDDEVALLTDGMKKSLTLKEAQELLEKRAKLKEKTQIDTKNNVVEDSYNKSMAQTSSAFLKSDDESVTSLEPKRVLRRERKVNPRYSSSEYTSIFNCKKVTFITKQTSPVKSTILSSMPKIDAKLKKTDFIVENDEIPEKVMHTEKIKGSEQSKLMFERNSLDEDHELKDCISSSDEVNSFLDKEKLFIQSKNEDDKCKEHRKLKSYKNLKLKRNSYSMKRKHEVTESTAVKRPCSRSSVCSSSSEFTPDENKPFNCEKNEIYEDKKLNDCSVKVKDIFCKLIANNNGDLSNQKDVLTKNLHSKLVNNGEKKTNDSNTSKELSSL